MRRLTPLLNAGIRTGLPAKAVTPPLVLRALLGVLVSGLALGGCSDEPTLPEPDVHEPDVLEPDMAELGVDEPDPPGPVAPDESPPDEDAEDAEAPKLPEDPVAAAAAAETAREKQRKEMDKTARGLVASFRSRSYDPLRDVGLARLRGTATLAYGEARATYAITFDASQGEDGQVKVKPVSEPEGTPSGADRQVVRYANHSLRGSYQSVVYYYPATRLLFTRGRDNGRIVTAQPWKQDVQVGYRFDDEDLIVARSAISPRGTEVAKFQWRFFRGRYLLDRTTFAGTGTVIEYEYDEWRGVVLMSKATLIRGESELVVAFDYEDIEKGEPETPLKPVIVGPDPDPEHEHGHEHGHADDARKPR